MTDRPKYSTIMDLHLEKAATEKWGIVLGVDTCAPFQVTIRQIEPGSAVARTHLKVGDRITRINGTHCLGIKKEEIQKMFVTDTIDLEFSALLVGEAGQTNRKAARDNSTTYKPSSTNYNLGKTAAPHIRPAATNPPRPTPPSSITTGNTISCATTRAPITTTPYRPQVSAQTSDTNVLAAPGVQPGYKAVARPAFTLARPAYIATAPPKKPPPPSSFLLTRIPPNSTYQPQYNATCTVRNSGSGGGNAGRVSGAQLAYKPAAGAVPRPPPPATAAIAAAARPVSPSQSVPTRAPLSSAPSSSSSSSSFSSSSREVIDLVSDSSDDEQELALPPARVPAVPASSSARQPQAHARPVAPPRISSGSCHDAIEVVDDSDDDEGSGDGSGGDGSGDGSGSGSGGGGGGSGGGGGGAMSTLFLSNAVRPWNNSVAEDDSLQIAMQMLHDMIDTYPLVQQSAPSSSSSSSSSSTTLPPTSAGDCSLQGVVASSTTPDAKPTTLKRKLQSDSKSALSKGDHFFCGVKVKLEPVGFGCADVVDEVEEVPNPSDAEKERVKEDEEVRKKARGDTSVQGAGSGAAVTAGGGEDGDDDDEISFVGGNMTTMLEMPHARESCSVCPFMKPMTGPFSTAPRLNLIYCDFCYCYVCECKASECLYWATHAQATHKNAIWKVERNLLRSKLLLMIMPPSRRALFIQQSYKPKIMENNANGNSFSKVLDDVSFSLSVLFDGKPESESALQFTSADFLESIILLIHIFKKFQNEIREGSEGCRAMHFLAQAFLLTKTFTASFTHPTMLEAIKEDLSSLTNMMAVEFVKVMLQFTTRTSTSRVDWVHDSRMEESRVDVPGTFGKLQSSLVVGVIFAAMKDVHACPAAMLEFCIRQGDRLTAQCFYWLIDKKDVAAALMAFNHMHKLTAQRELSQSYVLEKTGCKRTHLILKYCTLLAVLAPSVDKIAHSDDLLCFYISKMFRRGGAVDGQAVAVLKKYVDVKGNPSASSSVSLPFVESLLMVKKSLGLGGVEGEVITIEEVPADMALPCLYFLLMRLSPFSYNTITGNLQRVHRFVLQVVLKDASENCKMLFLYFFHAWGILGEEYQGSAISENIASITCDMAREVIRREPSLLWILPPNILQHWSELKNECNFSEVFVPVSLGVNALGVYHVSARPAKALTSAALSSYVPLYLFTSIPNLKSSNFPHMKTLLPLMCKSVIVTVIDYIMNANRFKLSNLVMFVTFLKELNLDKTSTPLLMEFSQMSAFFLAASALNSSSGTNDTNDYHFTELLRGLVCYIKTLERPNSPLWLLWQALLSQILQKEVGENKFDMLNFILLEDWTTLDATYFSCQGSTVAHTQKFKNALLVSRPSDIDVENKNACIYLWQRICAVSPQLINTLANSSEPTILDTIIYHACDNMVEMTPHLKSPALFRMIRRIVLSSNPPNVPQSVIAALQSKWTELKRIAGKNLEIFVEDPTLRPSRNDVLLCIVLHLKDTFAALYPRLTSNQDLVELFRKNMTLEETVFLVENTMSTLRPAILHNSIFRQQLTVVFQQFEHFTSLTQVSSQCLVEVMAILFPSAHTISAFMSQKDNLDAQHVSDVFAHFQDLLTNDLEKSNISVADAFQLHAHFSDEQGLKKFFMNLYIRRVNPLSCDNFIANCFSHMQKVGREEGGVVLSWLVAFCYRFHHDVNRDVLFSLQKNLLEFLRHVDCYDFNLTENSQSTQSSQSSQASHQRVSQVSQVHQASPEASQIDAGTQESKESEHGDDLCQVPDPPVTDDFVGTNLTVDDVYCDIFEMDGEEELKLFRPKFAFNFLQLIICPQSEKYEVLPVHMLSPTAKRITLHFLFDIEHPNAFVTTAVRCGEFACLNETIVNIPFDNPQWLKILECLLGELKPTGPRPENEPHAPPPMKRSRGEPFRASEFLSYSIELLIKFQVMLQIQGPNPVRSDTIKGIFYHLNSLLSLPSDCGILKSVVIFKAIDVLKIVDAMTMSGIDQKHFGLVAELCNFTATAMWPNPPDKIRRYFELVTLQFHVDKLLALKVDGFVASHAATSWRRVLEKVDFRGALRGMLVGVLPGVLSLLDDVSSQGEAAYVASMQALITCARSDNRESVMTLLPFISECLDSPNLHNAMTSFHLTSGYLTTALWVQFINDMSSHATDPSLMLFMTFLCQVAASLHGLTLSTFLAAAASAAKNKLSQRWLIVLLDLVVVDGLPNAQAVASFLFSLPKEGFHYTSEFWHKMFDKIRHHHLASLAMSVCTESRCSDSQFVNTLLSHDDILTGLTIDLAAPELLGIEPNHGLHVLWGVILKHDDDLIVTMMKNLVVFLLTDRLSMQKKIQFSSFLSKMKNLYFKANKFSEWRSFCSSASTLSSKKKALALILSDAMSAPL